jgi:hypothetical protein
MSRKRSYPHARGNPAKRLKQTKGVSKSQMLPPVPKLPRRDVRTDVHVALQLFNVNTDEEWEILNIPLSREEFDNWFKGEQIPLSRMEELNTAVGEWLKAFLTDPFKRRDQFKLPPNEVLTKKTPKPDNLLPITIDLTADGRRFRDFFLWNPNSGVDLTEFVHQLVADLKLPSSVVPQIVESTLAQIQQFQTSPKPGPQDIKDDLQRGYIVIEFRDSFRGIRVADKFLWNPYDDAVSPEEFALQYVLDVGLSAEWSVLLAHTIRSRVYEHRVAIAQKKASGFQYSGQHFKTFVRSCEELDTEKWQPTVLVLKKN